jgi:RNA polymerase sigma factor (sigma-70 family)
MINNEFQNIEEQQLWGTFVQGDDNSLETLYRRYFDELFAFGNKWLNNTMLTEDSIQDLFVKLMRNRSNLSIPVSVRYYLFRSFRSIVLDKLKAKNKLQLVDEAGAHLFLFDLCPEKQMMEAEEDSLLRKKLATAFEALTPRQREAVFLRYIQGFSYKEVADLMSLTSKGTYKLMARAIEALKEHMIGLLLLALLKKILLSLSCLNFFLLVG